MGQRFDIMPARLQENITVDVARSIQEMLAVDDRVGHIFPPNYSYQSELKSAMLMLADVKDRNGVPALAVCSQASIMSCLRNMVLQGLSLSKKQMYPIVYGDQLSFQRSYFGTVNTLERMFPDLKVHAQVIHEGDHYDYEIAMEGYEHIVNHQSSLENRDKPIIGAYCNIYNKKTKELEYAGVMTINEIKVSWSHAKTHKVHDEFPQEMAKRTVINRVCKMYVNAHENSVPAEQVAAYNASTEEEYIPSAPQSMPSAVEQDKAKAIKAKSHGSAGLEALLNPAPEPEPMEEAQQELQEAEAQPEPAPVEEKAEEGEWIIHQGTTEHVGFDDDVIPF